MRRASGHSLLCRQRIDRLQELRRRVAGSPTTLGSIMPVAFDLTQGVTKEERMRSAPVLDTDKRPGSKLRPKQYLRPSGIARRVGAFVLREREMLPPTIFIGLLPAARSSSEKPCWLLTRRDRSVATIARH